MKPCPATPKKARYRTSSLAWHVGARHIKAEGYPLYIYKCPSCRGWHLSRMQGPNSIKIDTEASRNCA